MSLDYGLGTMTTTTYRPQGNKHNDIFNVSKENKNTNDINNNDIITMAQNIK